MGSVKPGDPRRPLLFDGGDEASGEPEPIDCALLTDSIRRLGSSVVRAHRASVHADARTPTE